MMARRYEALLMFSAQASESEVARQVAQVEEAIRKFGGQPDGVQPMGRRRLAYRIAKQTEGAYHLLRFRAPGPQVAELDRLLRLNEAVLRHLILSEDELGAPAAPAPAGLGRPPGRQRTADHAAARAAAPGARS
jgi:small subunit ribosomal protein S6